MFLRAARVYLNRYVVATRDEIAREFIAMKKTGRIIACFSIAIAGIAQADSITVDGKSYENVYVTETGAMYYVQVPSEGRSFSVLKNKVDPATVIILKDPVQRKALLDAYKQNRAKTLAIPNQSSPAPDTPTLRQTPFAAPVSISASKDLGDRTPLIDVPVGTPLANLQPPAVVGADGHTLPQRVNEELKEDYEKGFREKEETVDANGTRKLVLKGSSQKDPAREEYVRQYYENERQRAEEANREQLQYDLEQKRINAEIEKEAIQAEVQQMRLEEERLRSTPRTYVIDYPHAGWPVSIGIPSQVSNTNSTNPPSTGTSSTFQTQAGTHGGNYEGFLHGNDYDATR